MKKIPNSFTYKSFLLVFSLLICFAVQSQVITELQKVTASDREANEMFGHSVDISGEYAIVGADNEGTLTNKVKSREGAAYIFKRKADGSWQEVQKLMANDRGPEDRFGTSVAISGKYAFIGAPGNRLDEYGNNEIRWAGAAYIFERDENGQWQQIQKLVGLRQGTAEFGESISVHQDYLVIGAPIETTGASSQTVGIRGGAVYIYKRNNSGKWLLEQRVTASDKKKDTYYGRAISIQGNMLAVGSHWETHDASNKNPLKCAGAVYIYKREANGNWKESQKIVPSDRALEDFFGSALDMKGKTLAIGAHRQASNSEVIVGATYMFRLQEDSTWKEIQKLRASDPGKLDAFGGDVEVEGDIVIISSSGDYDDAEGKRPLLESGSCYMFIQDECGKWRQVQKFTPIARGYSSNFGNAIAMDGKNVLIAAVHEEKNASNQNPIHDCGAAYFFSINGMGTNPCNDELVSNEISETVVTVEAEVIEDEKTDNGVTISIKDCKIVLTANDKNANYQWIDCTNGNKPIAKENKREFFPTTNGNYAVMLTRNNISLLSKCFEVKITEEVNDEEGLGENTFNILPNPNSGVFQIEVSGKIKDGIPIEIVSPFGKIIYESTITQVLTPIDLGKVKKGIYIVKIKSNEGIKKILLYIE